MSVLTRPAVLLAAASVAAGLLVAPGAAYAADTTTTLTAAQMAAELKAIASKSATAGAQGWKTTSDYRFTFSSTSTVIDGDGTTTADLVHGLYSDRFSATGLGTANVFAADHKGIYDEVQESTERKALKMMGKSAVKYQFAADTSFDLDEYIEESAPSPVALTTGFDGGGTKVTHDDGSADITATDEDNTNIVLHVGTTGVLTGADLAVKDGSVTLDMTFAYGPQTVTLPSVAETITPAALAKGVAYIEMPASVKMLANSAAADTRSGAKGKTVKVANLRKAARTEVTAWNKSSPVKVTVKNVTGGVKISATNPWTKATVTYTVKASGKKVNVKKA
ncbi:hypothetical protein FB565_008379 [Actinoplanes lutulentus]|uniref:Htaa protein n=1 Tax=Actinoplanes lutulentus TaxID=1287878 RepID=A0A327Z5I7_9ACTN|nr:hypothetical protein [Actinoplanes lutulentus]MBB2948596.1 hypothetical protein [Actinoplanes lutulentus]RAK28033.1 hypothetical protein B0I29_121129 [Actinoplanes lutulentus]